MDPADGDDGEGSERVRAHRAQLERLGEKMARLRGRVGQLQQAVQKLSSEQANVAGQLGRATDAVHKVIDVAETAARRDDHRPPDGPSGTAPGQPASARGRDGAEADAGAASPTKN